VVNRAPFWNTFTEPLFWAIRSLPSGANVMALVGPNPPATSVSWNPSGRVVGDDSVFERLDRKAAAHLSGVLRMAGERLCGGATADEWRDDP